ncbi:secretion/conjugation apparatus DotM-related subunit [Ramlibacter sp. AN1133]|uniref:secretion/conjugation apparatus DotM-related subunit n=1 Tax=Ramlibacter sp. AN1133 TaxID=3133429 RepID=UPI0030BF7048
MLAPLGAALAILFTFGFLIWITAGNRIVFGTLRPALYVAAMYKLVDAPFALACWNEVVRLVQEFAQAPWKVSFVSWMGLVALAFRPLAAVVMVCYLVALLFVAGSRKHFKRRFDAVQLMHLTVKTFTGIAPVVAIREQIAKNKHPKWRRQVPPDEVFLNYRVPKDAIGLAPAGTPMIRDGTFDREVARTYFTGISSAPQNGRQRSVMLGRQIVNLVEDSKFAASVVFADRLSNEGKALLALWTAVAFGGKEGREEFCKYRDMLNHSSFGTRDGMANLSLVQPLYDKYRKHPKLGKIFAIHHWEHTALFFLLAQAQKKGRFTTAEVLWLRPTNRVMFFALNSRGSYTPHTEAAATFSQFGFEEACARNGRLPLQRHPEGGLMHVIYVEKAVDGLELEYVRWAEGSDGDDDWWLKSDVWSRSNTAVMELARQAAAAVPTAPMPGTAEDQATDFDRASSAQAEAAALAEQQQLLNEIARHGGNDELAAAFGAGGTTHLS